MAFADDGGDTAAPCDALARSDEQPVGGEQIVEVAVEPHLGRHQQDQVVAAVFDIGEQVGGEDDADAVFSDGVHQGGQEFAPC